MQFNSKQQLAKEKLTEFVSQEEHNFFYLIGYAGTGKTMVTSNVIGEIAKNAQIPIHISAPTNQATNIIENYFVKYNPTIMKYNVSFQTIHRILEVKTSIDPNTGNNYFFTNLGKQMDEDTVMTLSQYRLIIIDECSMISKYMYRSIVDIANKFRIKIIFMGDPYQLPPVGEKISPVFDEINKTYPYYVKLNEVMRASNNTVKDVSKVIRKWDGESSIINDLIAMYQKLNKDDNSFRIYHNKNLDPASNLIKKIIRLIKNDGTPVIVVWRNQTVKNYTETIRRILHGTNKLDYSVGDSIIINKYYKSKECKLYTSTILTITNIKKSNYKLYNFNKLMTLKESGFDEFLVSSIKKINCVYAKKLSFCKIIAIETEKQREVKIIAPYNACYQHYQEYIELIKKEIINFIASTKLDADNVDKLWKSYNTNFIDRVADINYSYSITVHKSQGSTFKNVFVDITDILLNSNKNEKKTCLYTAVGRCSENLNIIV